MNNNRWKELDEVTAMVNKAREGLKETLDPKNRLDVDKLMERIIWGEKSHFTNIPLGHDNEGNAKGF